MGRALLSAMVVSLVFTTSIQAQGADKPGNPREQLRYDGKPFAYWESLGRNELKAERRVDAIDALAAFGSRGYAKEATAAIVEMLKDYDNTTAAFEFDASKPELMTPDQRVIKEALWALQKIGPDASPVVLAHLNLKGINVIAATLYGHQKNRTQVRISESALPILAETMASKDGDARRSAMDVLGNAFDDESTAKDETRFQKAFAAVVANSEMENAIITALTQEVKNGHPLYAPLLGALGARAKSAIPVLARLAAQRDNVEETLRDLGATNADRVAGAIAEFKDEKSEYRGIAAQKLTEMGAEARAALPDLIAEIKKPLQKRKDMDESSARFSRLAVIDAYAKIAGGKEALPLIAGLIEKGRASKLEHEFAPTFFDGELVKIYLKREGDPKRIASALTFSLKRLLATAAAQKDRNWMYTSYRVDATARFYSGYPGDIGRSGPTEILTELVGALGAQGQHGAVAVPAMLDAFEIAEPNGKLSIIVALGKIGPSAKDALPALSKILQSDNADLRRAAAEAIQAITKK